MYVVSKDARIELLECHASYCEFFCRKINETDFSKSGCLSQTRKSFWSAVRRVSLFFSNLTIRIGTRRKKNWSAGVKRKGFLKNWIKIQNLVLRDTRLKAFLTISFNDFERRNHGSQRAEMSLPITFQRNCSDRRSHNKFNKRGSIFSMGVQLSNGRYI